MSTPKTPFEILGGLIKPVTSEQADASIMDRHGGYRELSCDNDSSALPLFTEGLGPVELKKSADPSRSHNP